MPVADRVAQSQYPRATATTPDLLISSHTARCGWCYAYDLIRFVKSPLTNKYFSAQTRKQIEIGIQLAKYATEDATNETPAEILLNLLNQSLTRDEGWKEYYSEEMNSLEEYEENKNVYSILKKEYEAELSFSLGDIERACSTIQSLCDQFNNNPSEKGWYLQQLARYKYRQSKIESNAIQTTAFQLNLQLLKPKDGINYKKIEYINQNRIYRIRKWLQKFANYQDMTIHLDGILQNLSFGMPSEKFEAALMEVGELLGFLSQRPDKEIKKGPDNLWCGVSNQYVLLECKNEVEDTRAEISKYEAGQMNSHSAWFDSNYPDAKCKRIIIIPTLKLSYYADFSHDVEVMRKSKLQFLKSNLRAFFKEFSSYKINDISDEKINQFLDVHKLDVGSIISNYSEPYKKMSG